jgi:hypothetical protein
MSAIEAFEKWWAGVYGNEKQRSHKSLAKKAWIAALTRYEVTQ